MLLPRFERPSDAEWSAFLDARPFGQLIAGSGRDLVIVPTHFRRDGRTGALEGHLDRRNPVFDALARDGAAWLAVTDDYAFVPGHWNAREGRPTGWGAPTSYYAAVHVFGRVEVTTDPNALAALLNRQIAQLQPEGGTDEVTPDHPHFGPMLGAIAGWRLVVEEVRARFKYGTPNGVAHRERVASLLERRGEGRDREAAQRVRATLRPES